MVFFFLYFFHIQQQCDKKKENMISCRVYQLGSTKCVNVAGFTPQISLQLLYSYYNVLCEHLFWYYNYICFKKKQKTIDYHSGEKYFSNVEILKRIIDHRYYLCNNVSRTVCPIIVNELTGVLLRKCFGFKCQLYYFTFSMINFLEKSIFF